jgi:hypothetical protein
MADPFSSSKRELARAKEHILDLDRQIKLFNESVPKTVTVKVDPQIEDEQPYKIKLVKPLPPALAETVSDIVDNLRAALDQAGYGIAVAAARLPLNTAHSPLRGVLRNLKMRSTGGPKIFRRTSVRSFATSSHTEEGTICSGHSTKRNMRR